MVRRINARRKKSSTNDWLLSPKNLQEVEHYFPRSLTLLIGLEIMALEIVKFFLLTVFTDLLVVYTNEA